MTITTAQIRGARGILNWSQSDLSERTGISATSLGSIESGNSVPRAHTLEKIKNSFESAGIEFLEADGVRKKEDIITTIYGKDALSKLLDDIYMTLFETGGEVLIFGLEEKQPDDTAEYKKIKSHLDRITKVNITERIILKKGDSNLLAPERYYRWVDADYFSPYPFIIYKNKLALLNWEDNKILIIDSAVFSGTFKKVFDFVWNNASNKK